MNLSADITLEKLAEIVGIEHATDSLVVMKRYSRDLSFCPSRMPDYVVFPDTVSQVQELVRIANRYKTPVIPSSSSTSLRGGAIPEKGGVIVDLQRMNHILEFDHINWLVSIEPGVTFTQLQTELQKKGFRVAAPLLALHTASVISTYLDREPLITAADFIYGNELIAVINMIMPNGEPFTVGHPKRGIPPNYGTAPANIDGPGLNFYKLFLGSQGTMGIATGMVLRVLPLPKEQRIFFMPFGDLGAAIKTIQKIQRREIGLECFALNDFNMATFLLKETLSDSKALKNGEYVRIGKKAQWSAVQLDQFKSLKKQLPPWLVILSLTGWGRLPDEKIDYQEQDLRDILADTGVVLLRSLNGITGMDDLITDDLLHPVRMQKRFGYKGSCHGLCFYSEAKKAAEFEKTIHQVTGKHRYPPADVGGFILPVERARTFYCEYDLHCDVSTPLSLEKAGSLFTDISETLIDRGAFFDRPYGPWARMMYSRTGTYTKYLKRLKQRLDPNGIMNPGKLCF